MTRSQSYLSVLIPAFNEEANIKLGLLTPVFTFLKKQPFSWEVIIIDDGSTDGTLKALRKFAIKQQNCKIISIAHGGKAFAVQAGVRAAKGQVILFTDFDQSTPLKHITDFIKRHEIGQDIVIGARHASINVKTHNDTFFRRFRSWVFVSLVKKILQIDARDTQCGFKSFKSSVAKKLFSSLSITTKSRAKDAYMGAFDVELLFLAKKYGYSISEVPVSWTKIESTRLNVWKEPIKMLIDVIKIRFER